MKYVVALALVAALFSGLSWNTGRSTLEALESLTEVRVMETQELVDRWTARLGETGSREVVVRTPREDGEDDDTFSARHESLVQARAALAPPIV